MTTQDEINLPYGETGIPASLALPESGDGPWPAVVVIHEITGLNDDIRRIARRFADSGYVALAPNLFAGLGPTPICIVRTVAAYRRGGGRALEIIDAAKDFLAHRSDVDGSRIGVAGFCMGGGFALLMGTTARSELLQRSTVMCHAERTTSKGFARSSPATAVRIASSRRGAAASSDILGNSVSRTMLRSTTMPGTAS